MALQRASDAQAGIFAEFGDHHQYLEYRLSPGADERSVRAALREALPVTDADGPHAVLALGPAAWRRLGRDAAVPIRAFETIRGEDCEAPSTQSDLLLWVHGAGRDAAFDAALRAHQRLEGVAEVSLDEAGFSYRDSRDLTGFVDGTANPKGEAAVEAAIVAPGQPGAGGSFVLSQLWIHDLMGFGALEVAAQERVIGRTKAESIELEGDAMPGDSHVSRTDLPGTKIWRRSAPVGRPSRCGLYFLAFGCDLERFDRLLASMFGTTADGVRDRLTSYSQPVSGSYFFAPGRTALSALLDG